MPQGSGFRTEQLMTDQEIVNNIIKGLRTQWQKVNTSPFPHCRVEDTGNPAATWRAELYYNPDEKVLTFHYNDFAELIATGETVNIDPDTHYSLIPVYPEVKDIPGGWLLSYSFSGLLYSAHGRFGSKYVDYYHCPLCNGFIYGFPLHIPDTRAGINGAAIYCRRCGAELTFNTPINARKG